MTGRWSRNDVDRWASQWVFGPAGMVDEVVWWGLMLLAGIDLRHGPDGPFLHDDAQIADWLAGYRARCAASAEPTSGSGGIG